MILNAVLLVPLRLQLLAVDYSRGAVPIPPQHLVRRSSLGSGLVHQVASMLQAARLPSGLRQHRPQGAVADYLEEDQRVVHSGHLLRMLLEQRPVTPLEGSGLTRRVVASLAAARHSRQALLLPVLHLDLALLLLPTCFQPRGRQVVSRAPHLLRIRLRPRQMVRP